MNIQSASYMTGADVGAILESHPNPFGNEFNIGSSHMQARNDRNLKYMLNEFYNGRWHQFFATDPKQLYYDPYI